MALPPHGFIEYLKTNREEYLAYLAAEKLAVPFTGLATATATATDAKYQELKKTPGAVEAFIAKYPALPKVKKSKAKAGAAASAPKSCLQDSIDTVEEPGYATKYDTKHFFYIDEDRDDCYIIAEAQLDDSMVGEKKFDACLRNDELIDHYTIMILTILGAIIGLYLSYMIASFVGMDFSKWGLGTGDLFITAATLVCAGIGFGYGFSLLLTGNHLYNLLFKLFT